MKNINVYLVFYYFSGTLEENLVFAADHPTKNNVVISLFDEGRSFMRPVRPEFYLLKNSKPFFSIPIRFFKLDSKQQTYVMEKYLNDARRRFDAGMPFPVTDKTRSTATVITKDKLYKEDHETAQWFESIFMHSIEASSLANHLREIYNSKLQ